jgi:hypothetical protein
LTTDGAAFFIFKTNFFAHAGLFFVHFLKTTFCNFNFFKLMSTNGSFEIGHFGLQMYLGWALT